MHWSRGGHEAELPGYRSEPATMSVPHLVIAAGGTGGHMFPAQALAEEMLHRGWSVSLSTDARGSGYASSFPNEVTREVVASATFARGGLLAKLWAPFRILSGVLATRRAMMRMGPACVAGFGGYPAIPAMAAAWWLGLPRLIHEQNGIPGRVNRLFAPRVDRVACAMWPTRLPAGSRAVHTGNPVRGSIAALIGAPYASPAEVEVLNVLVIGGSQGARILSDVVPAALALLPDDLRTRLRVTHQARQEDGTRVIAAYEKSRIEADVMAFISDVPERLVAAQLVISRAGASSISEISTIGRPSILIPYAAAMDDHQTANARVLHDAGAAEMISEEALTPQGLSAHIAAILQTDGRAARMADRALSAAVPDATQRLADLVETLSQTQRTE